jgi:hypothetical protein
MAEARISQLLMRKVTIGAACQIAEHISGTPLDAAAFN